MAAGRRISAGKLGVLVSLAVFASVMVTAPAMAAPFTGPENFAAGSNPVSVAVGDFDGDGDPDLAVANIFGNDVSVLLGGAGGTFSAPTNFAAGDGPRSVAVGDFNADGDPDLAVANFFDGDSVSVLLGGAGGTFSAPTNFAAGSGRGSGPFSVAVGDFNGDGDPDLAVANQSSNNVSILLGGTGGTFSAPTNFAAGSNPLSVAAGDFNADGDPDLAVANGSGNNVSVLLGGADGTFSAPTNFAAGTGPASVAVGDFNADGDPDLAVANQSSNNVSILLGGADGTFSAPTNFAAGSNPLSVAVGDFNADGDPDLAVANGSGNNVSILLGRNPDGPTGLASSPASPANDNSPKIKGAAQSGSTVRVYATSDCSGEPAATGSAADFASPGLTVTVADDSSTTFRATATDDGGTSPCSTSSVTYQEDSPASQNPDDASEQPGESPTTGGGEPTPGTASAGPPSITGLTVARRCVRSPTMSAPKAGKRGLSFSFSLSQDAVVSYEIRRRDGSPRWSFCPRRGGKRAGTYTGVSRSQERTQAGRHDMTLANTASHRDRRGVLRLRHGRRHLSLARAAAGRKLTPGTYVLRMTATNANGRSTLVSVKFWVLGPRR